MGVFEDEEDLGRGLFEEEEERRKKRIGGIGDERERSMGKKRRMG